MALLLGEEKIVSPLVRPSVLSFVRKTTWRKEDRFFLLLRLRLMDTTLQRKRTKKKREIDKVV